MTTSIRKIVENTGILIARKMIHPDTALSFVIINLTFLLLGDGSVLNFAPKIGIVRLYRDDDASPVPPGTSGESYGFMKPDFAHFASES
jgi:hypothetical protein